MRLLYKFNNKRMQYTTVNDPYNASFTFRDNSLIVGLSYAINKK